MHTGRTPTFLNQLGPWPPLDRVPGFVPLQWDRDGIVLGINVMVDLMRSEDSKEKRDAGWDNEWPLSGYYKKPQSNRRGQIFFFTLTGKPLPWRMPGAHSPWYLFYLEYHREEFWSFPGRGMNTWPTEGFIKIIKMIVSGALEMTPVPRNLKHSCKLIHLCPSLPKTG